MTKVSILLEGRARPSIGLYRTIKRMVQLPIMFHNSFIYSPMYLAPDFVLYKAFLFLEKSIELKSNSEWLSLV